MRFNGSIYLFKALLVFLMLFLTTGKNNIVLADQIICSNLSAKGVSRRARRLCIAAACRCFFKPTDISLCLTSTVLRASQNYPSKPSIHMKQDSKCTVAARGCQENNPSACIEAVVFCRVNFRTNAWTDETGRELIDVCARLNKLL